MDDQGDCHRHNTCGSMTSLSASGACSFQAATRSLVQIDSAAILNEQPSAHIKPFFYATNDAIRLLMAAGSDDDLWHPTILSLPSSPFPRGHAVSRATDGPSTTGGRLSFATVAIGVQVNHRLFVFLMPTS
jgi:hypothetical protein